MCNDAIETLTEGIELVAGRCYACPTQTYQKKKKKKKKEKNRGFTQKLNHNGNNSLKVKFFLTFGVMSATTAWEAKRARGVTATYRIYVKCFCTTTYQIMYNFVGNLNHPCTTFVGSRLKSKAYNCNLSRARNQTICILKVL